MLLGWSHGEAFWSQRLSQIRSHCYVMSLQRPPWASPKGSLSHSIGSSDGRCVQVQPYDRHVWQIAKASIVLVG